MKKRKSLAVRITAARTATPLTALALTTTALAVAMAVIGCSGTGRTEIGPESQVEITAGPIVNRPESPKQSLDNRSGEGPATYVDGFCDAVNHDMLESWEIPAGQADMSWFREAWEDNYSKANDLIRQVSFEAGRTGQEAGNGLYNIHALSLTDLDQGTRDREGYGRTAGAFLKGIDSADSVTGFLKACFQFQGNTGLSSLMG